MKIVFLDSDTMKKPHESLDFSKISSLGEFVSYPRCEDDEVIGRAQDADVLMFIKPNITRKIIAKLPKLKFIIRAGTGYDNVDTEAAREQGIAVANIPGYGTYMVAQWTMMLLQALAGSVLQYDQGLRQGRWFDSHYQYPIVELQGKTLGIVGYGSIAKQVIQLAKAFAMKVIVVSNHPDPNADGIKFVDLDTLVKQADFISLHRVLTEKSKNMLTQQHFQQMKPSCYLINTGRAALVNEADLIAALQNHQIAGVALDVFWQEPPSQDHPLLKMDNVILTPHMAWGSPETRQHLINLVADTISCFFAGKPINIVNGVDVKTHQ